jgi:guanyl-specific ribonuclease Sa
MSAPPWLQSPFSSPGTAPLFPGLLAPQESAFGITVPTGDPSKLDHAAGLWAGMAHTFSDQAVQIRNDAATMTGTPWSGQAGAAFGALATDVAGWFDKAANGCRTAAPACRQLATALRDAQKAARDAIHRATDADGRQQAAHAQLEQANTRADAARSATTDAKVRMSLADQSHPIGQAAYQSASQDHVRAEKDLTTAQADALNATGQKNTAQDDLKKAQADGGQATTQLKQAEHQASAAFEAAGQALIPNLCLATAPVPIDPARTDRPELDVGAPGLAGLQPIGVTPANMRSQQLFKDYYDEKAAEEKAAAKQHGNYFDALGGELTGLAGVRLFGNDKTEVFQSGEKVGNVLGYLPTPAAVERIGARAAIKEGERLAVNEGEHVAEKGAAKQGEKAGASALESLSPGVRSDVDDAIERAASGKVRFPGHDGKVYNNSDGLLPGGGNYTEWTAAKAGVQRGANRVIIEGNPASPNAIYYWDHVNPPVRIGP